MIFPFLSYSVPFQNTPVLYILNYHHRFLLKYHHRFLSQLPPFGNPFLITTYHRFDISTIFTIGSLFNYHHRFLYKIPITKFLLPLLPHTPYLPIHLHPILNTYLKDVTILCHYVLVRSTPSHFLSTHQLHFYPSYGLKSKHQIPLGLSHPVISPLYLG